MDKGNSSDYAVFGSITKKDGQIVERILVINDPRLQKEYEDSLENGNAD